MQKDIAFFVAIEKTLEQKWCCTIALWCNEWKSSVNVKNTLDSVEVCIPKMQHSSNYILNHFPFPQLLPMRFYAKCSIFIQLDGIAVLGNEVGVEEKNTITFII